MTISTDDLRAWSAITATDPNTIAGLDVAVAAANAIVQRRCVLFIGDWPPEVTTAALILAARFYKRRGSPEGVSGFGDLGAIRISSYDADVEAMLGPYLIVAFA